MLEPWLAPLGTPEMSAGGLAGVVALGAVLGLSLTLGRRARFVGVALVLAVAVAAGTVGAVPDRSVWIGMLGLGVAAVVRRRGGPPWLWWLLAAAGLLLVTARLGGMTDGWRLTVTALGLLVVGAIVRFEEASPHAGRAPALLFAAAGGIYATVPDTEQALVLLGAALPLAVLGWPMRWGRLGALGAPLVGGLLVWVVATGGVGRAGSVVGGLACAGLLLCDPLARAVAGGSALDRLARNWRGGLLLVVAQAGVALIASRVAGLQDSALGALLYAGPLLAAVTALLVVGRRRGPGRSPARSTRTL